MSMTVLKAGLQTSLQGAPYAGHRHLGMPAAGAADCLSLALANFLVGKSFGDIAFEITLTDALFQMSEPSLVAVVGGAEYVRINDKDHPQHQSLRINAGDTLHIGPSRPGCRTYLSVSSAIEAEKLLDGQSTYLAAGLGGYHGRALQNGDAIALSQVSPVSEVERVTPENLRPHYSNNHVLRVTPGPEARKPNDGVLDGLCLSPYTVSARANRMGIALEGNPLGAGKSAEMSSAAVFPGTIQMPPSGQPYLLGPDAQTTGGYPRIAQVIRADRHLIGQLGPGSKVQFVQTTTERATEIHREKLSLLSSWLGQINLW